MILRPILAMVALGLPAAAFAQEDEGSGTIIVTATGQEQDRDESGQAITIIDSATIETRQTQNLAALLATTPSVRINSNGSLGSVTGLSLRGAETGQTLVLIDGVRVNDPSSTSDAVDFGNLLVANLQRIEIMRGANAVPYGSEAIGGVINLSTRDDSASDGLALRAMAEGGYAGTVTGVADAGYRQGGLRFDAGIAGLRTDGISSAAPRFGASERDGLDNLTAHGRIEAALSDAVTLDLRGYAVDARLDYDSFFGSPADSADESHFTQYTGYAGLRATSFGGQLESRVSLTYLRNRRDYRFAPDTPADFGYRGERWRAEYQGNATLDPAVRLLFGYTHDAPVYRFFGFGSDERHSANTDSVHGLAILQPLSRLTLSGGLRHDEHSQFGGVTTFGANGNWGLGDEKTRFRFAYGEGFRAPSLYQLYDTFSGNKLLQPERAHSFDLGVDRRFAAGKGTIALTVFSRVTRNQIDYDLATFTYSNLARTLTRGLELSVDVQPVKDFTIALTYSLLDTRDRSPGSLTYDRHLPRRPVNSASLSLDRRWSFGLSTGATLRVTSDSRDPTAPGEHLDSYELLDLRASLPLTERLELHARLENAFDAQYETAYGYASYGRAAYGGIRMRL